MSLHWVRISWVAAYSLIVICCWVWVWCLGGVRPWGVILPRYCWVIFCDRPFLGLYLLVIW